MKRVSISEINSQVSDQADDAAQEAPTPAEFTQAVESMHSARLRDELTLGTIRPPQRLAP